MNETEACGIVFLDIAEEVSGNNVCSDVEKEANKGIIVFSDVEEEENNDDDIFLDVEEAVNDNNVVFSDVEGRPLRCCGW